MNAASPNSDLLPVKAAGYFIPEEDETTYSYTFIIPAGESRSVMVILGQHRNVSDAVTDAERIATMPSEIFAGTDGLTIVNWLDCSATFEIVNPQSLYCTSSPLITFTSSNSDAAITFNGNTVSLTEKQFSTVVLLGANQISYTRPGLSCTTQTLDFDFKLPEADLAFAINTSGLLPSASVSGGYGDYSYSWSFTTGGDLASALGTTATLTVTDSEGCTATAAIELPTIEVHADAPIATGSVPVATPRSTSSSSRLVGSLLALSALCLLF